MIFYFEKHTSISLNNKIPNFLKLQASITAHPQFKNNLILHHALHAVKYKIEAANLYILILNEVFTLTEGDKNFLKRTMIENIIFNLSSLLDSLAHAINQIYKASIDFTKVQMDHQGDPKKCVRCYIDNINDGLSTYLNSELPQRNKFTNHWYYDFIEYRNQIMHRTLYMLLLEPGLDYLPDDPTNLSQPTYVKDQNGKPIFDPKTGKPILSNYTKFRELRLYSKEIFDKIFAIIEETCKLLIPKI